MQVFVGKGFSGEIVRMEIDADTTAENQVKKIARNFFGWAQTEGSYSLVNLTKNFEYSPDDVLKESTAENDILIIINSNNCSGSEK